MRPARNSPRLMPRPQPRPDASDWLRIAAVKKAAHRITFDWGKVLLAGYSALVYLFLYVPIIVLIVFSFNKARQTAVWQGFTLDWYRTLAGDERVLGAVKNSLQVAGITTVVSTVIGTLAALAIGRHRFRGKTATQALVYLPIVIPEIVLGAALVTFFGVTQCRLGLWTVVMAHIAFSISYVIVVVRARLAGFDRALEEAAMDLGANALQTFFRVTLPLIAPGVISGGLFAFAASFDEVVVTLFLAGPEQTTLPRQMFAGIKENISPTIAAAATVLILFSIVLLLTLEWLRGRSEKMRTAASAA